MGKIIKISRIHVVSNGNANHMNSKTDTDAMMELNFTTMDDLIVMIDNFYHKKNKVKS